MTVHALLQDTPAWSQPTKLGSWSCHTGLQSGNDQHSTAIPPPRNSALICHRAHYFPTQPFSTATGGFCPWKIFSLFSCSKSDTPRSWMFAPLHRHNLRPRPRPSSSSSKSQKPKSRTRTNPPR